MRSDAYSGILERITSLPGVRGALVVAVPDGLIVDGRVHVGVRGDAVAALAASLYRRAVRMANPEPRDRVQFLELDAEDGRILIAGGRELAIMTVVEKRANPGRARLAVRRAAVEMVASTGPG